LRHVERCRVLVHLVDLSAGEEGRTPLKDFTIINRELKKYSPELAQKPQIVVANKLDLPYAREALPKFVAAMKKKNIKVFELSGVTGEGAQAVLDECGKLLFNAAVEKKVRLKARAKEKVAPKTKPAAKSKKAKAPARKAAKKK
jgi:GTP-binding protein